VINSLICNIACDGQYGVTYIMRVHPQSGWLDSHFGDTPSVITASRLVPGALVLLGNFTRPFHIVDEHSLSTNASCRFLKLNRIAV